MLGRDWPSSGPIEVGVMVTSPAPASNFRECKHCIDANIRLNTKSSNGAILSGGEQRCPCIDHSRPLLIVLRSPPFSAPIASWIATYPVKWYAQIILLGSCRLVVSSLSRLFPSWKIHKGVGFKAAPPAPFDLFQF